MATVAGSRTSVGKRETCSPKQGRRGFGAEQGGKGPAGSGQQPDVDQAPQPDHGLERRIYGSRRSGPPYRAIERKGANREPAEKPGDRTEHRHHFGPEREAQLTRPHDLVAEAREAGRCDDQYQRPA